MAEYNASKSGWGFTHHHCRVVGGALIKLITDLHPFVQNPSARSRAAERLGGGGLVNVLSHHMK